MDYDVFAEWPEGLPKNPLLDSYSEKRRGLMQSVTTGNKSTLARKAASRSQVPLTVDFVFDRNQTIMFEHFFDVTLDGGGKMFRIAHPRKGTDMYATFDPTQETAYTITPCGSRNYWKVSTQFLIWSDE